MSTVLIFAVMLFSFMALLPFLTKDFVNQDFTNELDHLLEVSLRKNELLSAPIRVLYQHDQILSDSVSKFGKRDALLLIGNQYAITVLITNTQTHLIEFVSELRARRTLFNKPKEYLAAFGERPDRKQLARLMGGAEE